MRNLKSAHHVGLVVRDLDFSMRWYQEKFGFKLRSQDHLPDLGLKIAYIRLGDFELELFESQSFKPLTEPEMDLLPSLQYQGIRHLAFATDDCDAAWDELDSLGIERHIAPTNNGALGVRYCFAKDPDGILLEFVQIL